MEEGQNLIGDGTGFSEVDLPSAGAIIPAGSDGLPISTVSALSNSRFTLKELHLAFLLGSSSTFDFVSYCSNLVKLTLRLAQVDQQAEIIKLCVPPEGVERNAELESLRLELYKFEIVWNDAVSNWIGKRLREFVFLNVDWREPSLPVASNLPSILHNSKNPLRIIGAYGKHSILSQA